VPQFAPVIDGVGDYALNLGRHLREGFGMSSRFVVCDPLWNGPGAIEEFQVEGPSGLSRERLSSMIEHASTIVLHYVGYGYHPKGIPNWLGDAVLAAKERRNVKLVTIFHEIWSSGPPWRSVFYLRPLQKRLAARILKASDHAFSSTVWATKALETLAPQRVSWMPIPSNVPGEVRSQRRAPTGGWTPIFFGQTWTRTPAVACHRQLIKGLIERKLLDRIVVMGKQATGFPNPSEDVALLAEFVPREKIEVLGERGAGEVSEGFSRGDFYLSFHPARDACKSGAVMAAFACGCPAIMADGSESEPLRRGVHFLSYDDSPRAISEFIERLSRDGLRIVGENALAWYAEHADWRVVAERVARCLKSDAAVAV
jgi:glycosyltransferase involved in cell wall biosynthesis